MSERYPLKQKWSKKFATLPIITYNNKVIWLKFYYEKRIFYDWPPTKVQSKIKYAINDGLLAMLDT